MKSRSFAQLLRSARRSADLTVTEAARRAGIHRVSWHRWESGARQPTWEVVQALARALGISSEKLRTDH